MISLLEKLHQSAFSKTAALARCIAARRAGASPALPACPGAALLACFPLHRSFLFHPLAFLSIHLLHFVSAFDLKLSEAKLACVSKLAW